MKGHIRERGKGNWYAVIDRPDPATGRRRQKWQKLKAKGKRGAQIECAQLISQVSDGVYIDSKKVTLRQFLEIWLAFKKPNVSPASYQRYEDLALKSIAPLLGEITLTRLQPIQISQAYAKAVESGRRDGRGGLSPRTIHHMHRVLRQALAQAMKWNKLVKNPCDMLERKDRPKIEKKAVATLDAAATMKMLEAARGCRWFVPMLLGSMCGIRRGEIAALRWDDVQWEQEQITVKNSIEQTRGGICREKETKGSKCRTIAMPVLLIEELKAWRLRQAQEFLRLGMRPDGNTRVVTKADGSSPNPQSLTDVVSRFMKGQGSGVRLHGLRHSHASHLLAENVHPKIVQERLGHYSIAITMDIYSHLMPNMQADAAAKVDAALRAAKKPT
jgi:integrase